MYKINYRKNIIGGSNLSINESSETYLKIDENESFSKNAFIVNSSRLLI